jgi:signal transduction histidine kinase
MKPLKLYTRTTILISALLTAVLLVAVYFFIARTREFEVQDQEHRAQLWATQMANLLANEARDLTALRRRALSFREAHEGQIRQIRIYGQTAKGLREEIQLAPDEPEEIPARDLEALRRGATISRTVRLGDGETANYAAAPILDDRRFRGVVSLTTTRVKYSDLSQRIMRLTLGLLAVAIVSITALLYFLFSQVLYRPVEDLLQTMAAVRTGDLEVEAPVRARDEFGQLSTSFNHMIARLREMTAERAAYQKGLEERVLEATGALAERNAQLEEANATLFGIQRELTKFERLAAAGQLAAQFAHEVGTPLNLISGHVQLLASRTTDARLRERLDLISSQIGRIERIVRHMLDATRRPRPDFAPLDLNALLRRIFEVTAPTLAAHEVELIAELDEALPPVCGDGEQLQQVFINLINNGLDAMPQGGRLTFATGIEEGLAFVRCRDTGEGISDEFRAQIFDPLFTTKARGSGLGLTIVQQIIREHGGAIEVDSAPGRGAEFRLRLPLAPVSSTAAEPLAAGNRHD